MYLYRLCKEKYATLDGYGAFLYGGRWNSAGRPLVYTAENRALAALEFLVGVEQHREMGPLVMLTLQVPDDIKYEALESKELPTAWRRFPALQHLAKRGNEWLGQNKTCLLKVPSIHVPEEYNYLLNPLHTDFTKIQVIGQKAFYFDDRLLT